MERLDTALIRHFGNLYAFLRVLFEKTVDEIWKVLSFFPGDYGRIEEILHGRLRPDWGLYIYRGNYNGWPENPVHKPLLRLGPHFVYNFTLFSDIMQ